MFIKVSWYVIEHPQVVSVENNFNKCYNKHLEDIFY